MKKNDKRGIGDAKHEIKPFAHVLKLDGNRILVFSELYFLVTLILSSWQNRNVFYKSICLHACDDDWKVLYFGSN